MVVEDRKFASHRYNVIIIMFNSFFISQKMDMPLPPERLAV